MSYTIQPYKQENLSAVCHLLNNAWHAGAKVDRVFWRCEKVIKKE